MQEKTCRLNKQQVSIAVSLSGLGWTAQQSGNMRLLLARKTQGLHAVRMSSIQNERLCRSNAYEENQTNNTHSLSHTEEGSVTDKGVDNYWTFSFLISQVYCMIDRGGWQSHDLGDWRKRMRKDCQWQFGIRSFPLQRRQGKKQLHQTIRQLTLYSYTGTHKHVIMLFGNSGQEDEGLTFDT